MRRLFATTLYVLPHTNTTQTLSASKPFLQKKGLLFLCFILAFTRNTYLRCTARFGNHRPCQTESNASKLLTLLQAHESRCHPFYITSNYWVFKSLHVHIQYRPLPNPSVYLNRSSQEQIATTTEPPILEIIRPLSSYATGHSKSRLILRLGW